MFSCKDDVHVQVPVDDDDGDVDGVGESAPVFTDVTCRPA